MKKQTSILLAALAVTTLHAAAQGSLTPPPGAPAPVMKSLDQVEARTPLVTGQPGVTVDGTTGAITITAPGSYYLTGNLTTTGTASCVDVGSHTCTIDLNGFVVSRTTGTESTSAGIMINAVSRQRVMIRNGYIRGGGTTEGIADAIWCGGFFGPVAGVHVENIHCVNVRGGITLFSLGARHTVRNCSVENSGSYGIYAEIVSDCVVRDTAGPAITGQVINNCYVVQNFSSGEGIVAPSGKGQTLVTNCSSITNTGTAIRARSVMSSTALASGNGAKAIEADLVTNSAAEAGSGVAINANTANGCRIISGTATITNKYNMP